MKPKRAPIPVLAVLLACLLALAPRAGQAAPAALREPAAGGLSGAARPSLRHALSVQAEGSWILEPHDSWWFSYAAGGWPASRWEWIGWGWFWFDANGWMQRGWQYVYGNWFHLGPSGAMDTGWLFDGGSWYYLGPDGWMRRDWTNVGGTWYWLAPSGVMATGWLDRGGNTYYLADNGVMQTGWTWVRDGWYYFWPDGHMARSEQAPDGERVDANGRWDPSAAPATPTTPASPSSPDAPASPASPVTPQTAQTPSSPASPSTALTPDTAQTPATVSTPQSPSTPASPENPTTSEVPESAATPTTPVLPVTPAHTVTSTSPKLLYTRTYSPATQAESSGSGWKAINGQKIICTIDELESWGDELVIHYSGEQPRLSMAYIPGWDDAMYSAIDAVAATKGGWSKLSGETYSWYNWTGIKASDSSPAGEAHFPIATIREEWEKKRDSSSGTSSWTYSWGDGLTRNINSFSIICPYWTVSNTTDGTIQPTTITSIEITGHSSTRNVPASTPLMTREQVVRNFAAGINLSGTFECTQYTKASTTDSFWGNTTYSYVSGPALWSNPAPISDLDYEVVWHNPRTTKAVLNGIKAAGFSSIRIPVSWGEHITYENGTYHIDAAWMARVHEVVDYAYDAGLYVVLNTHHEQRWLERPDLDTAYEQIKPVFTWLWHSIAEEFKDYDQRLVFEGMNEPRASGAGLNNPREWGWCELRDAIVLNKLNQDFVDTVRAASGPYNKVRVCSVQAKACSSTPSTLGSIRVPDDPYVAVSVHIYRPSGYYEPSDPATVASFTAEHQRSIDEAFEGVQLLTYNNKFGLKGVPMYIGEYGFTDAGNATAREQAVRYYNTWAKQMAMPSFYWVNCKLYDRRTLAWSSIQGSEGPVIMSVWNNSSIVWGSKVGQVNTRFTKALSSGTELSYSYSSGKQGENDTATHAEIVKGGTNQPAVNLAGYDISNKDIAIHFTGYPPHIRMVDKTSWKGWIIVEPYLIVPDDSQLTGYTAYWTHEQLADVWSKAVASGKGDLPAGAEFNYFAVSTYGGAQNPDPYGPTVIGPPYLLS